MGTDSKERKAPETWRVAVALGLVCLVFGVLAYGSNTGAVLLMFALALLVGGGVARILRGPSRG